MIEKSFCIFFNSSIQSGAVNKSANGSRFDVNLTSPLIFPDAEYIALSVIQANVWNNAFNISEERENNQWAYYNDISGSTYQSTIPDGLYTINALQDFIVLSLLNEGFNGDEIQIIGDTSTSKVIIFVKADFQVDFTIANSVRTILGFDSQEIPPAPAVTDTFETAENVAQFNFVDTYQIRSNLVNNGIPTNQNGYGIITTVPISAPPNSLIVYQPQNPLEIDVTYLSGQQKNNIQFELLNQDFETVSTNGEDYSLVIKFRYIV
jgi:hypothetical protein